MDKYVTLKFYRVEQGRGAREPFSEILERLQAVDEANRERIFEDVPFWIDKLVEDQGIWLTTYQFQPRMVDGQTRGVMKARFQTG